MTNAEKHAALSAFRVADGKTAFKDFRPARHQAELDAYEKAEAARKVAASKPVKGDKTPTYKELAKDNYVKSSIDSPVAFIHSFLDENPTLGRKASVAALLEKGINYSTARTQYQRWFANRKKEA